MKKENTPSKPAKRYAPTRWEVAKTVIIAVLITSIVSFIVGMQFANSQHAQVEAAVTKAQAAVTAEPEQPVKK